MQKGDLVRLKDGVYGNSTLAQKDGYLWIVQASAYKNRNRDWFIEVKSVATGETYAYYPHRFEKETTDAEA